MSAADVLFVFCIHILIFVAVLLFARLINWKCCKRAYRAVKWGMFIALFIESYLALSLSVFINLDQLYFHNFTEILSSSVTFLVLGIVIVIFPIWTTIFLVRKGLEVFRNPSYYDNYGPLYKEFRTKEKLMYIYYGQFFIRRLTLAFSVVFLIPYPEF